MRSSSSSTNRSIPKPGWVEHDPNEVWQRCRQVMDGALGKVGGGAGSIAALGVTNQRETAVVWDRSTGEPVHNAIVWQDTRTDKICEELEKEGGQDRFRLEDRASDRDVLLGTEGPMDPRERRWGSRESRCRGPGVRQHGHLVHLEPDRRHQRRAAHHRRVQRQPHDADGPRDARLGRRAVRRDRRSEVDAARDPCVEHALRRGQGWRVCGRPSRGRPR